MTMRSSLSADAQALMSFEANKKSMGVSYLLWFFLGAFGGHRFYLGRTGSAVAMLLMGIFGWLTIWVVIGFFLLIPLTVWWLVDAFLIPEIVRNHNNALMARLNTSAASPLSSAEELAQYASLHDRGAISDEEYAAQKARILS